jgi:hypothetical protein
MQNPEPRFYPSFPMKMDWEKWRALPSGVRAARAWNYNDEIWRLLFERVQQIHPTWSEQQHQMMFFRLRYAGEHFDGYARARIARGDWRPDEVEAVQTIPIPFGREDGQKYTAISHPDLDEDARIWPSAAERGSNF